MSVRATAKKCFVSTSTNMLEQIFAHIVEKTLMRLIGVEIVKKDGFIKKNTVCFIKARKFGGLFNG